MGITQIAMGVYRGVTGVVTRPVEGAIRDGAGGFMRGVSRGIVGLVLEPLVGASGGVAKIVEGIANTSSALDPRHELTDARVRPRRVFYGKHRVMRPYSRLDAFAKAALDVGLSGSGGGGAAGAFVCAVTDGDACVVATSERVAVMDMSREWRLLLSVAWSEVSSVAYNEEGVLLGCEGGRTVDIPCTHVGDVYAAVMRGTEER